MSDAIDIKIHDYDESMAEGVAQMWNTWDELWPGGFTQGVPYTAERVQKQLGKLNALAILVAIDQENKKPVGSCTLFAHWRDAEATYVGTLGVSPEALGKKVGKRMLLESIQRAFDKGYSRVDLNTWAGNMKAVPLYKKIGMMWNPEISGVHMEDYIPGILKHPLCSPFFVPLSGNGDWYGAHVREPIQAPDDNKKNGMAIYPYEFVHNDNALSVTIDRLGRGITAIERTIDGKKLRVDASVNSHQVLCGLHYTYKLEIENGSENELDISVNLQTFDGLVFDDKSSMKNKVSPGETAVWEVPFHLDSSAVLSSRSDIKTSNIIAVLTVDQLTSELHTGLKVKSVAEIRTHWGENRLAAGGSVSIPLTVVNNLSETATASIRLRDFKHPIKVEAEDTEVTLSSDGFGGTMLKVTSEVELEEGTYDIWVSFDIKYGNDSKVTTRDFRIPVYCLGTKGIAVGHDDRQKRIIVTSTKYNAAIADEGGIIRFSDPNATDSVGLTVRSAIGPPFGISPFRFADRKATINSTDSETIVSMEANHPDRPLIIEDRTIFEHGTGIVQHEVWATNTNNESETFQLRLVGAGGGISFARGTCYVPFSTGIVKENLGNFYSMYPGTTSSPSDFSEGWIATEQESGVVGQFWDLKNIEELRLGYGQMSMIAYPLITLEPGATTRLSQIWFVFGASDWAEIRRLWQTKVEGYYETRVDALKPQEIRGLANLELEPIIVPHVKDVEAKLTLSKHTLAPLMGNLRVLAPAGWTAAIGPGDLEVRDLVDGEIASCGVQLMTDSTFDLKLSPAKSQQDGFSIQRGKAVFNTDWDVTKKLILLQLGASKGKVEVAENIDQGSKVLHVNNGLIDFTVSPDYGGCLISLKNQNGVEFMTSSFPNPSPKPGGFFDNYYGGVQPIVFDEGMGEDLDKARTNRESMKAKPYESGIWKGVDISWTGKLQKLSRGMKFNLRYLTTPGSRIVLIQWVITNKTNAPMKFIPSLFIDPKLDEQLAGSSFVTEWNGKPMEIRKGMVPIGVTPSNNSVWIKAVDEQESTTGLAFMMAGDSTRMLSVNLGEILILGMVDGNAWIKPGEQHVITGCLFVDPESAEDVQDLQEVLDRVI